MNTSRAALLHGLTDRLPDGVTAVDVRADSGRLALTYQGGTHQVHLPDNAVTDLMATAVDDARDAFGVTVSPIEAALRFLAIHLEECLSSLSLPPGAELVHEDGGFRVDTDG